MPQLAISSKRLLQVSDPFSIATELNRIVSEFIDDGWNVKRGIAGIVILTLQGGEVHFVSSGRGIEEIIFERGINNE
jgi:hypothetical protein